MGCAASWPEAGLATDKNDELARTSRQRRNVENIRSSLDDLKSNPKRSDDDVLHQFGILALAGEAERTADEEPV